MGINDLANCFSRPPTHSTKLAKAHVPKAHAFIWHAYKCMCVLLGFYCLCCFFLIFCIRQDDLYFFVCVVSHILSFYQYHQHSISMTAWLRSVTSSWVTTKNMCVVYVIMFLCACMCVWRERRKRERVRKR